VSRPTVTLIWAMSADRVIGRDGDLPWHLPDDLKRFKRVTSGGSVIMGRKTWQSIGGKPLPDRQNIVVTRTDGFPAPGALIAPSLPSALAKVTTDRAFVIGGAALFAEALDEADRLEVTHIHADIEGDVLMPEVGWSGWSLVADEVHPADAAHAWPFSFRTYHRAGRSCGPSTNSS